VRSAIDEVATSAGTVQLRASVHLADGRIANNVLVTSLGPAGGTAGAVLAFRVGRPFAAVDAYGAVAVAEIVSLELARSRSDEREATERRQALALYEVARHGLFCEDLGETLQSIAMVLASTLDHDAVHIWLRHSDRALRRHAAYPHDPLTSATVWESDHSALTGAIRDRRLVRMSRPAQWTPSNASEFLIAPLRGDARPVGVLVLARRAPYELDDIEMADVLGTFIGRVVASSTTSRAFSFQDRPASRSASGVETEEEPAERN
jgi:transcriptional regulator with GAF, ATPase, and Fis domain